MKKKYLSLIRRNLIKEMELYNKTEDLILEYRAKFEYLMVLCSRAMNLEGFTVAETAVTTMSNLTSDLRELDEDSKKCLMRINAYRKILGLQPMLG